MSLKQTIDIVIPSYRLDESLLLPVFQLPPPPGYALFFFVVVDNPVVEVPASLRGLASEGKINLLLNKTTTGPGAARNRGMAAGTGKWILLLDDDIRADQQLLQAYADAIAKNPDAIGFVGLTDFPPPVNAATKALLINGTLTHFRLPLYKESMVWAPTANVLLNRDKMDEGLFDESLVKSGEDIEFMARNSFRFSEQYVSVPQARVLHPWWGGGALQLKRLFRYGQGGSDLSRKAVVKPYTYYDFPNTAESFLLLSLLTPVAILFDFFEWIVVLAVAVLLAEFLTNWVKAMLKGKTGSPLVAFYLLCVKNAYEAGFLHRSMEAGYIKGFGLRMELGFVKPNPGSFRLNRWKIIKSVLVGLIFLVLALLATG